MCWNLKCKWNRIYWKGGKAHAPGSFTWIVPDVLWGLLGVMEVLVGKGRPGCNLESPLCIQFCLNA